ncbi:MAG: YcxB family protein [Bacteroidetes bacterium]|nr:YcxB family protein [Bacteroidota bacterium]
MKKLTGWILIIFCSIFLLIFATALVAIIPGVMTNDYKIHTYIKEILTTSFGFLVVITLLIIGLKNGLKRIRKDKVMVIIDYDKDLKINLKGQIKYHDYRNLILGISFKKPIYLVAFGIMILFSLTYFTNSENMANQFESNYFIFIIIGIFIFSPIFTLIQIKKLYKTNKLFQEQLNYSLTNNSIQIKGSTVDSTQSWTHFYKFKDTKNFFMFYQGKMVATLLDKKMFSESELIEFQRFIKSLNVKREQ